jgi:hypothetical protein
MPCPHRAARTETQRGASKKSEAMRIRLLGGFRVSVGEHSIGDDQWRLRKAASLVKLLALQPGTSDAPGATHGPALAEAGCESDR